MFHSNARRLKAFVMLTYFNIINIPLSEDFETNKGCPYGLFQNTVIVIVLREPQAS